MSNNGKWIAIMKGTLYLYLSSDGHKTYSSFPSGIGQTSAYSYCLW